MSTMAMLVPLAVGACFGLVGPAAARRLPPRHATWLLSAGGTLAALCALAVPCVLAAVLIGQIPDIANHGHWSTVTLRDRAPAEPGIWAASLLAVVAAGVAILHVSVRRVLDVVRAHRACRSISATPGGLVVVTDAPIGAVAVPGRPGRIVVARSLLDALSGRERGAILAHERAHLEHGHHWHRSVVSIAAAANPLLAPLRTAIVDATERWADEDAAAQIGDRRAVASALARAALLGHRPPAAAAPLLAAASHAVSGRVEALLGRPPRPRPVLSAALVALLLAAAVCALIVAQNADHLFDVAGDAYRSTHGR